MTTEGAPLTRQPAAPAYVELVTTVPRDARAIACPQCKGYAEQVTPTDAEQVKFGCGRKWHCCDRAFVCIRCGTRLAGKAEAPEAI